jgi:hypothetical protein
MDVLRQPRANRFTVVFGPRENGSSHGNNRAEEK